MASLAYTALVNGLEDRRALSPLLRHARPPALSPSPTRLGQHVDVALARLDYEVSVAQVQLAATGTADPARLSAAYAGAQELCAAVGASLLRPHNN
jgi:hypothetical protein